jgi:CubicO group peptidase (beta-lactamase class C family)
MRTVLKIALVAVSLALVWAGYTLLATARLATAFVAKTMCSAVFVSQRTPASVYRDELADYTYISAQVDTSQKIVTASIHGLAARSALYRPGLGATLAIGCEIKELQNQAGQALLPQPILQEGQLWPLGNEVDTTSTPAGIDRQKLSSVLTNAFAENHPGALRLTRGVVVVYKGQLIAERYGNGFAVHTPQLGWSMTKSAMNALIGILVGDGLLHIQAPLPLPEWQGAKDPRNRITLHHLLHMSSGLEFDENYGATINDVTRMLFGTDDASAFALHKKRVYPVGTHFAYSSGTSNILSRIMYTATGRSLANHWSLPRRRLFDRLGMASAVIEPDATGILVGASFMYATARDWARLGLLYLQDGVWQGERVLPEGWVRYSITPDSSARRGEYGAQLWLNVGPPSHPEQRPQPQLPADLFGFRGHDGQFVWIIPSRHLVVVRLGYTRKSAAWNTNEFLNDLLSAIQVDNKK